METFGDSQVSELATLEWGALLQEGLMKPRWMQTVEFMLETLGFRVLTAEDEDDDDEYNVTMMMMVMVMMMMMMIMIIIIGEVAASMAATALPLVIRRVTSDMTDDAACVGAPALRVLWRSTAGMAP